MADMTSLNEGYRALVIGASGGIGAAIVTDLLGDPRCGSVISLSRRDDAGFDLTDEASVEAAAARLKEAHGEFELIFDATGALEIDGKGPEKTIRAIDPVAMAAQFAVNAIGPALLVKHFCPLLSKGRRSVFVTLSARVGSIGDNRLDFLPRRQGGAQPDRPHRGDRTDAQPSKIAACRTASGHGGNPSWCRVSQGCADRVHADAIGGENAGSAE